MTKRLMDLKIGHQGVNDMAALGGLPIYLAVMLVSILAGQKGLFWQLFAGIIFVYFILILIRYAYFRPRPDKQAYSNLLEKIDASSFPSLHAMRATTLLFIIAAFFSQPFITILAALIVFGVCWARVLLKRHYWKDVLFGILLGLVIGLVSTAIY